MKKKNKNLKNLKFYFSFNLINLKKIIFFKILKKKKKKKKRL